MTAAAFLEQLKSYGVSLRVNGPKLRVEAPVGVVTLELRQQIADCKGELMRLIVSTGENDLQNDSSPALVASPLGYLAPAGLPDEWREYYEHRAAIREYEGNQPREHAEAQAWCETLAAIQACRREK